MIVDPITIMADSTTDSASNHVLGVLFITLENSTPIIHMYRLLK